MDISKTLRAEIQRRGLSVTAVAEGAEVPFSTVSEFLRDVRDVGSATASKIATFLGFELVKSRLERKAMADYLALVEDLEKRGYAVDDATVKSTEEFAKNLRLIKEQGYDDWNEDDVALAAQFASDLKVVADAGYGSAWNEDDAELARSFCSDLEWLYSHGWGSWSEEDASEAARFVADLKALEAMGEEATLDRIEQVAEFVRNLREMQKKRKR